MVTHTNSNHGRLMVTQDELGYSNLTKGLEMKLIYLKLKLLSSVGERQVKLI